MTGRTGEGGAPAFPLVPVVGDPEPRPIRKVAVLGGSGRELRADAMRAGADVLVTGDIDYHTAMDALAAGFAARSMPATTSRRS